jgi:hypothetical protein
MEATQTNAVASLLSGIVQEAAYLCTRDLEASSDEISSCTQDGKCRSMLAMAAELSMFNNLIASVLRGEGGSFPTPEERDALAAQLVTKAEVIGAMQESVGAVVSAIESIEENDWMTKITAPWGMEVTKAHLASWSALHMMYHDGQINLVQILNGDHEVHWMS